MHARRFTLFGAACAAIIASASLASSGVDVRAEPPTSPADSGGRSADKAVANGALVLPTSAPPDVSAIESKTLGRPNHALSARPAVDDGASGPLAALDPRTNEIVRVGGALAAVLGLLLLTRTVLRRAPGVLGGAGRPAGVVEVLARYPIARGQSLVVLRVARRVLLLHHAGTSMQTLSELADPEEVAAMLTRMEAGSRSREATRFRAKLRDFEDEHDRALAQDATAPRNTLDRGEIVDLTQGSGRRLSLRGLTRSSRRRLSA